MDRAAFLEAVRAAAPKLRKVDLPLFPDPVYLRRMSVAESRQLAEDAQAERDAEGDAPKLGDARVVAAMVRDETGALLFDRADRAAMLDLQTALDAMDAAVVQELLKATSLLNEPTSGEADAAGN